jgi:hypothetical protein
LALGIPSSHGAVFTIALSPSGGALNLGSTIYTTDSAVGLSGLNEVPPSGSPATGNIVGGGITYDDVTNIINFDFAYGSAFGFVDFVVDDSGGVAFTTVHFQAAGPVGINAGVIHDLSAFHTPSGQVSGRVTGNVVLSAAQEVDLFDNVIYVNLRSVNSPAGEVRGQLVPVPEPSTVLLGLIAGGACLIRRRR